jgi:CRP-like cAMP-binding protein
MAKPTLPPDNLLAALPAALSRGLFEKARTVTLAADQMLFLAGDAGDGCYRVEEGLLKASVVAPGGSERILAIFGPGSLVGELSMIDGEPRSASVAALRPSKLSLVSRSGFEAFASSNPELYRHVMTMLARRLRETNGALAATSFLPLKGRVAGIARENVSRILKEWTDRKIVSRLAGYYCLENKAAIEREGNI